LPRWRGKCSGWNACVGARETASPARERREHYAWRIFPMAKSRVTMAARIGAADTERKYKKVLATSFFALWVQIRDNLFRERGMGGSYIWNR